MGKYRKKPIVIEAEQFFENNCGPPDGCPIAGVVFDGDGHTFIETLEGPLFVSDGDWIITGVRGEKYPCKPDIFEATYDPAEAT